MIVELKELLPALLERVYTLEVAVHRLSIEKVNKEGLEDVLKYNHPSKKNNCDDPCCQCRCKRSNNHV